MTGPGSNEGRKGTRVTFLDQTGAKSVDAVIADTVTVKRILPNIITKMNLPVMGPDGQPMSYSLDHKEGGRRLRDDQTLMDAQVGDGDHLIVYPEIVAGRVSSMRESRESADCETIARRWSNCVRRVRSGLRRGG